MSTAAATVFDVQRLDEASAASRLVLEDTKKKYGFIPNLYGVLAHSAAAVHAYAGLNEILGKHGSLSPREQQAAILAISVENGCTYCVAAHSVVAEQSGLDRKDVDALRDERPLDDAKLEALSIFARQVVKERGWVGGEPLEAFTAAGYQPADALEVVTLVALKTLSNYTNHIADTPLDEAFAGRSWQK
jgi:uncharacterized peroxidase-related enzyme